MRYNCSLTRTRRLTSSSRSSANSHRDQLIRSQVHIRIDSVHLAALDNSFGAIEATIARATTKRRLHRIRTHRVSKADLPPRNRLRTRSLGIVRPSRTVLTGRDLRQRPGVGSVVRMTIKLASAHLGSPLITRLFSEDLS
jgi:hypothetical protein